MLKAFESLVSLLEAAANKVVHDTRHFMSCPLSWYGGWEARLVSKEVVSKTVHGGKVRRRLIGMQGDYYIIFSLK